MRNYNMSNKQTLPSNKVLNQERSFDLSLPIIVKGLDATGREFQEQTELQTISSQMATFWIDSGVTIGSKINLCLEVPKTIILEKQIRLLLSGDIIFIKEDGRDHKKNLISVRLDKNYKIRPQFLHSNLH